MKFFFDNNLSPRLAKALNELAGTNHEVIHLREKFAPNISDIEWIKVLAEEKNWVIISGDIKITKKPHERQAWLDSKLTAFFLKKAWISKSDFWNISWRLIRWFPYIVPDRKPHFFARFLFWMAECFKSFFHALGMNKGFKVP